jgi:hypothetical protein
MLRVYSVLVAATQGTHGEGAFGRRQGVSAPLFFDDPAALSSKIGPHAFLDAAEFGAMAFNEYYGADRADNITDLAQTVCDQIRVTSGSKSLMRSTDTVCDLASHLDDIRSAFDEHLETHEASEPVSRFMEATDIWREMQGVFGCGHAGSDWKHEWDAGLEALLPRISALLPLFENQAVMRVIATSTAVATNLDDQEELSAKLRWLGYAASNLDVVHHWLLNGACNTTTLSTVPQLAVHVEQLLQQFAAHTLTPGALANTSLDLDSALQDARRKFNEFSTSSFLQHSRKMPQCIGAMRSHMMQHPNKPGATVTLSNGVVMPRIASGSAHRGDTNKIFPNALKAGTQYAPPCNVCDVH